MDANHHREGLNKTAVVVYVVSLPMVYLPMMTVVSFPMAHNKLINQLIMASLPMVNNEPTDHGALARGGEDSCS